MFEYIACQIINEVDNILNIGMIMFPVFLSMFDIEFMTRVIISILFYFIFCTAKNMSCNMNNELLDGMPVPEHRYTKVEDGMISLIDEEEAISYLCRIEDYLEFKRLL